MLTVFLSNNIIEHKQSAFSDSTYVHFFDFNRQLIHTELYNHYIQQYMSSIATNIDICTHMVIAYEFGYDMIINNAKYPELQKLDICWVVFKSKTATPENFDKLKNMFNNTDNPHKLHICELSEKETEFSAITKYVEPINDIILSYDNNHTEDDINDRLKDLVFTGVTINYFNKVCMKYDYNYVCRIDNDKLIITRVHGKQNTNLRLKVQRRIQHGIYTHGAKPHYINKDESMLPLNCNQSKDIKIALMSTFSFNNDEILYTLQI